MEPILGQIQLFAFGWAPTDWMPCQGQVLPIEENAALFSLLGTTYGGDGRTTFALPDLRGHTPSSSSESPDEGMSYCIAVVGVYPSRP